MLKITVIIPSATTAGRLKFLETSCNSLWKAHCSAIHLRVLVVTHNQHPRVETIKKYISTLIISQARAGFGELNNIAFANAYAGQNPDYYLLLNDDAWIERGFFRALFRIYRKTKPDIIAPLIYGATKERIDSYGVEYFTSGFALNASNKAHRTTLASASCLLVRSSLVRQMKKAYGFTFNPTLYYYIEDVEFCIRALALGATIYKSPNLIAHHIGSSTSKPESYFLYYYSLRNILWVILMTWPLHTILAHVVKIAIVYCWLLLTTQFRGKRSVPAKIVWDTIKHRKQLLQLREKILSVYPANFNFESIFSPYMFRTRRKDVPI